MKFANRISRIDFKLTPSERRAAERLAEIEGRSVSEAAREALRAARERRGISLSEIGESANEPKSDL